MSRLIAVHGMLASIGIIIAMVHILLPYMILPVYAGLERIPSMAMDLKHFLAAVCSVAKCLLDIAESKGIAGCQISGWLLMGDHLLLQRLTHIGDGWEGIIRDVHRIQRVLSQVTAFGHGDRHRLPALRAGPGQYRVDQPPPIVRPAHVRLADEAVGRGVGAQPAVHDESDDLMQLAATIPRVTSDPGAAADAVDRRRFSKPSCPARLILFRWGSSRQGCGS